MMKTSILRCVHWFLFGMFNIRPVLTQTIDAPRGPWQLAFKVVSGKWNATATGSATFWQLFTSTDSYNTASPVPDQRDFSATSNHYKSAIVQEWEDKIISVQAVKLSLFKNNIEKAYIVFNGVGKTKTTWFKCNNILYSSYSDLPDAAMGETCPGRTTSGFALTIMKVSYLQAQCSQTTGWLLGVDTNLGFSICTGYAPYDGTTAKPYFKYSRLATVADMSTELESADSMGIFFQVWDMVFKGIEGTKPTGIGNLTGLYLAGSTENDNSDSSVRNLQHTQSTYTYKSGLINAWQSYHIDTVKYSMLKSGVEKAYVVFNGVNSDQTTWFSKANILYSSFGTSLTSATSLDVCSIDGDTNRNWQIQGVAEDDGCSSTEQKGWMLVKEPRNNGTCSWDTNVLKKKPYFLYNTGTTSASPANFLYADVMAVFVKGWRLVFKVSADGLPSSTSSVYSLWTTAGSLNEGSAESSSLAAGKQAYKSPLIDQWTNHYIRAVKLAAYKAGAEVFHAVFDATGSSAVDWLDCKRLLYTSVSGLNSSTTYTCSVAGDTSTFRFLMGGSPNCGSVSATGVFALVDSDSSCSARTDRPQILYSNTLDTTLSDTTTALFADVLAIFFDLSNCDNGPCKNGATCQDIGGTFRCFCDGSYYGSTCSDLNGVYSAWTDWGSCSVTCENGVRTRTRTCAGAKGAGTCSGASQETTPCSLTPCPIDGGVSAWTAWTTCTLTCGGGTNNRSRDCNNPAPQQGGQDCSDSLTESSGCNTQSCPIDGGFTAWTNWTTCTQTCGGGTQARSRDCTNPAPQHGGNECVGNATESQSCNPQNCPINGGFTEWTNWTTCTHTCGGGTQARSRDCSNPAPQHGGNECVGSTTESQNCNPQNCPIDGGFTSWTNWTTCTQTCGGGTQARSRVCTNPAPQHGGNQCVGNATESQSCNTQNCPIDGGFTAWTNWTTCTQSCGGGTQSRSRDCTNPAPQHGGNECVGNATESQSCNTQNCPIDGGFTAWTNWTTCTQTCGGGTQSRSRDCTNPAPQHGGNDCVGNATESQSCNTQSCPIDGGFTAWTNWTTCTQTCGGGTQARSRDCTNPAPQHGGNECVGNATESQNCNTQNCPIDGGFTAWTNWTTCTQTCGGGTQARSRDCTNPAPQHGGNDCVGNATESQTCHTQNCPVDGGFTAWTNWTTCTQTCGGGTQARSRDCTNPAPQHGGNECVGNATESQTCHTQNCPIDGGFTAWTNWTTCTQTCGGGTQARSRDCTNPAPQHGGNECVGNATESQTCNTQNCPIDGGFTAWSNWTTCTQSCGGGTQARSRDCTNPTPQHGGNGCVGNAAESQICNTQSCPISVDGGFTAWTNWTTCTQTCGGGTQTRSRDCTNPAPQHGGNDCVGNATESQNCNTQNCIINGGFTAWTNWTTCTQSCGGGTQARSRDCTNPAPQHGGNECVGNTTESQTCNTQNCPIDGRFTAWTNWTTCTQSCGGGTQARSRDCTNPAPQHGGNECVGNATESQTCNTQNCPIDGVWGAWSQWADCTVTCNGGSRERARSCTPPQHGGNNCSGQSKETETCNTSTTCPPVDGAWSDWSNWTECTVTCGTGSRDRSRTCSPPQHGGQNCTGISSETSSCNNSSCPVNGYWSEWTNWTSCTSTCNVGIRGRMRMCHPPQHGGDECAGFPSEIEMCGTQACPPVDGGWSLWTDWSTCTHSCNTGNQTRTRTCTNPAPAYGGNTCTGLGNDVQSCNTVACPVDGAWGNWSDWTQCSDLTHSNCNSDCDCGIGITLSTRACDNPTPSNGGHPCDGGTVKNETCNVPCLNIQCDPANPSACHVFYEQKNTGSALHAWIPTNVVHFTLCALSFIYEFIL